MNSVLVIGALKASRDCLEDVLKSNGFEPIVFVPQIKDANEDFIQNDFSLCIINTMNFDKETKEFAIDISKNYTTQVILMCTNEECEKVNQVVEPYGVITLEKPLNKKQWTARLSLVRIFINKMNLMKNKNKKLLEKIEMMKIVSRAKYLLMSHLQMTEEQAHKYLEKQAMNRRVSRFEVAKSILKTYEE